MTKWEAVERILTSPNAWLVLAVVLVLVVYLARIARKGILKIHTKALSIGSNERELAIVRNQQEFAFNFIMAIQGKLNIKEQKFGGYFTKCILESVYDEVIKWIVQNHIVTNSAYVHTKQGLIKSIVYSHKDLDDAFKSETFEKRMDKWIAELIEELVNIRSVYENQ